MNLPSHSSDSKDLIRKALAPPPSTSSAPTTSKAPTPKTPLASKRRASKASSRKAPASKAPVLTSKIIEWDHQKGFGYLRHQKGKLFLHRNDFAERHKRPSVGDRIHYQTGTDPKGRRCAVNARHVNDGGKITIFTWIKLILLMTPPALAMGNFMIINKLPLLFLLLYLPTINLITYLSYKSDKDKARSKEWRTSETSLHFLEFIGGWPAALIAQRQFRHKCSKASFQITYWLIVFFHIGLAIDYMLDWAMLKTLIMLLTPPAS